ncbi:MAG TPA: HTTM domain-containing protein [Polyangiaceae bacterium]|jgi:vitamin K-dependent gamma-carboxylase|nr:HTTM domain-containing protein [Polyangiaceae bacterium]
MTKRDAWVAALVRPLDAAGLVAFRVLFGLLVAGGATRFLVNGWVERFYVEPTHFFKYWGFEWVRPWPAPWMQLHVTLVVVLGLCVAAGFCYRLSAIALFVAFTYLELIDVTGYLNHYYLLSLLALLLACMPLHQSASIDAWLRPRMRSATLPAWCYYLLRFQVAIVYFYAGLAKLSSDWLLHAQPLGIWLAARTDTPIVGTLFSHVEVAILMSWLAFLYDTTVWAWLLWPKSRPFAYLAVLGFHALTGLLFNIGMFPVIMIVATTVFFSPSWPRRFKRWRAEATKEDTRGWRELAVGSRCGLILMAGYALVQLLVPLRHYAYPGDVSWNEQGMRWSWKVMVREKNGAVTFWVTLPDGRRQVVTPRRYLNQQQEREMSGQPDLILQLAHDIARDFASRGDGDVEVRAEAWVSLNGRPAALLIDPNVDLARVADGLGAATWVMPEPPGAPVRSSALALNER